MYYLTYKSLHYEFAASKYNTYSNGEKRRALGLY